ncbi:unnamed protein product [Spirodela intermedia]|uniref:Uncharacterized protein n=1 Tax=Spirodela intermedia TaxID=51605 RepID=A0A7I8IW12_SPIIN|nr:unnamed protein product [Spirodela intermedia]CAA6661763.1 unnamed protein product [Spirodela intermedia]
MAPTPKAYNPVIQALFKQNKTREAVRLFREMTTKGRPADALSYKIVFRGLCRGGRHWRSGGFLGGDDGERVPAGVRHLLHARRGPARAGHGGLARQGRRPRHGPGRLFGRRSRNGQGVLQGPQIP